MALNPAVRLEVRVTFSMGYMGLGYGGMGSWVVYTCSTLTDGRLSMHHAHVTSTVQTPECKDHPSINITIRYTNYDIRPARCCEMVKKKIENGIKFALLY